MWKMSSGKVTAGFLEEFEGLIAIVDDGRGNLQVLHSIDVGVGDRGLEVQTRSTRDGDRREDEGDEGSTE